MSQAGHDDFAFEPIRGLPELPPEGERILWQGAPDWRGLAWRAFHVREVAIYFAALIAAQPVLAMLAGTSVAATAPGMAFLTAAALLTIAMLSGLAWGSARSTVYTITSRRVVLRIGMALPVTINLPFAVVAGAGLNGRRDGSGDIAISLGAGERASYVVLWPHARPWRLGRPEPLLRCLPDACHVADLLGRALAAHAGAPSPARSAAPTPANDARLPHGVAAAS